MKIIADGTEHNIEVKPLTLFFHDGTAKLKYPECLEITPEGTVATARDWANLSCTQQKRGRRMVERIFKLTKCLPEKWEPESLAEQHVAGMGIVLMECLDHGVRPALILPETYLHPKQQCELADMLLMLSRLDMADKIT